MNPDIAKIGTRVRYQPPPTAVETGEIIAVEGRLIQVRFDSNPNGPSWMSASHLEPVDEYRIALRPDDKDHPERMDDIVVMDVRMFRAEQMDDGEWWVCCYLDDTTDQRLTFSVRARCRPRRIDWDVTEYPDGDHAYEGGPPRLLP